MAACPKCGRTLATGARTCVYCAQGNAYQRRQELDVPREAMAKRRRGIPWGRIFLVLLVLAAVAVYFRPPVREKVDGLVRQLMSQF